MAGYTRQSVTDILDGEVVTANPLNNEFDQLVAAFHATTGHPHDGTTAGGPKIALTAGVSGVLPLANGGTNTTFSGATAGDSIIYTSGTALTYLKNNMAAVVAPAVTDDSGDGYAIGSVWVDTVLGKIYIASSVAVGAAVWVNTTDPAAIAAVIGKVKVSSADTTPDELYDKVTVGGKLTKAITSPAGDEKLYLEVLVTAATTTVPGLIAIATAAEVTAGTSDTVAMTPLRFALGLATSTIPGVISPTHYAVLNSVTAYAQTLVDDANAATARATLGLSDMERRNFTEVYN